MNTSRRLFLARSLAAIGSIPIIASTAWAQRKRFEYKYSVRELGSFNVRVAVCEQPECIKFMYLLFEDGLETGVRAETPWIKKDHSEGIMSRSCVGEASSVFAAQLSERLSQGFKSLEKMEKDLCEAKHFEYGFTSKSGPPDSYQVGNSDV